MRTLAWIALVACSSESSTNDSGADAASTIDAIAPADGASSDAPSDALVVDAGPCVKATRLWFEDFETGNYMRWSSSTYDDGWNNGLCHSNDFSTAQAVSATHSHRSEITCASNMSVHRGYGGVQFSGDMPLAQYTNQGQGIDAPFGVVNVYWSWLDVPYPFQNGRWFSFWTVNSSCNWSENVLTLGLENTSNVLTPAHVLSTGGTVQFAPSPPAFPLKQWVRTTIYVNYVTGVFHVWQNGQSVVHATFSRPTKRICQWHWGAYASGDNTSIVLHEDDNSIWKLGEAWTDFDKEPHLGKTVPACQ